MSKPVRCVETGEVFQSARAAAKALGVTPGMVSHVLTGRQRSVAGVKLEYATDVPKKPRAHQKRRSVPRAMVKDSAGRVYVNFTHLAKVKGVSPAYARYRVLRDGVYLEPMNDLFAPIPFERKDIVTSGDDPRVPERIRRIGAKLEKEWGRPAVYRETSVSWRVE